MRPTRLVLRLTWTADWPAIRSSTPVLVETVEEMARREYPSQSPITSYFKRSAVQDQVLDAIFLVNGENTQRCGEESLVISKICLVVAAATAAAAEAASPEMPITIDLTLEVAEQQQHLGKCRNQCSRGSMSLGANCALLSQPVH